MAASPSTPTPSFDGQRVVALLNGWYDGEMRSALRRPRAPEVARQTGGTVFDIQPVMSSTKAVRVLLDLQDIVGFEPSKKVIKKGGYRSKEEFVRDLSNRIEEEYSKH